MGHLLLKLGEVHQYVLEPTRELVCGSGVKEPDQEVPEGVEGHGSFVFTLHMYI
jgi:hypothetical protein